MSCSYCVFVVRRCVALASLVMATVAGLAHLPWRQQGTTGDDSWDRDRHVGRGGARCRRADPQRGHGSGTVRSRATRRGGYRVPDLGVNYGDYEIQASKTGFSTVVHKGIALNVGAQTIVDFALPVGQQQQRP